MKHAIYKSFSVLGLVFAILIGTIPFLGGAISGGLFRNKPAAVTLALVFSIALTFCSWLLPDAFRLGPVRFNFHDSLYIYGFPTVAINAVKNMIFGYVGCLAGAAFRDGFNAARSNKTRHSSPDRAESK